MYREPMVSIFTGVDARGLFDSLVAKDMGKMQDKTMLIYALAYRETLKFQIVRQLFWVPTCSMLADELTKDKEETSDDWWFLYQYGVWFPRICTELPEDLVTFDSVDGQVRRWRMENAYALRGLRQHGD